MKRIILLFTIFFSLFCYANNEQKQLTYSEQQEMLRYLNEKIKNNEFNNIFELGLVYEDGIIDANNKKIPDIKKATEYYILAFDKGDYRSVFKLVPMLIQKKEYEEALKTIQKGIDFSSEKRSMLISLVSLGSTLTMDYFGNDNEKLMDALYNISLVSKEELNNTPTLKFIKANLMNVVGDKIEAEKILNEACFSPNAPNELKKICFNTDNFLIAKDDVEKSIDECTSCSFVKE